MPKGRLFLVPTPIGNLGDITLRALEVLREVDLVLAEDTRKTGILLKHYGIQKKILSHHLHNEHRYVNSVVTRLLNGESVALVSDAGTPGISDPGYLLVKNCIGNGIMAECLPGPTALIPALMNSGLPSDRFCFEGFLPQKKGRSKRLQELAAETRTMIFYESPHRLNKCLAQMLMVFGPGRQASISRELTKLHEETIRGSLEQLSEYFNGKKILGEVVIVVAGQEKDDATIT